MENFTLKKSHFVDAEPSQKVWQSIVLGMDKKVVRRSLVVRFRYWYVAVPVFLFMIFGSYMTFTPSALDKEITQTQNAMNELISLTETEVF